MDASAREAAARVARELRARRRWTLLTGAGVSAASGVPTFRGADGLWKQYRAADLATPEAFARDPALVWEWYAWRRERVAACRPNRAHEVLAGWTRDNPGCCVVTQNVDDLHVRAGTERLVRLHGSIWELKCAAECGRPPERWRDERVPLPSRVPRCIHCGALARPAVVWFGEALDPADMHAASAAAHCDVFVTAGTSAVVYPAAGLVHEAKIRGALTVEINVDDTPATASVDVVVRAPAEEALDCIGRLLSS
jgi:NAD-dependent deacetylase